MRTTFAVAFSISSRFCFWKANVCQAVGFKELGETGPKEFAAYKGDRVRRV